MRGSVITGDDMFLYGVSFERTVESVRIELQKKLDAVTKYRTETFKKLETGLKEEKRKPIDPETVLNAVRRQPYHMHQRGMSDRVQKLVQLATVIARVDDMLERLGFFVDQLKQEQDRRLLTLSTSDVTFIYRPFNAEEFEQTCCSGGLYAGLAAPAATSMASVVGAAARRGLGYVPESDVDSVADALSDVGNDLDLGTS